jgi:hypothetical protein
LLPFADDLLKPFCLLLNFAECKILLLTITESFFSAIFSLTICWIQFFAEVSANRYL